MIRPEIETGEFIITGMMADEYGMAKAVYDAKRIVGDPSWIYELNWNLSNRRQRIWKLITHFKTYKRYLTK